jgi:polyferredoxin
MAFAAIGLGLSALRHNTAYFALFAGIGWLGSMFAAACQTFRRHARTLRLLLHWSLAGFFFLYMMMGVGINFQLSQVLFDALTGVVSGALIQLVVARLVLPFFIGNGFCSTICWDGAVFELLPLRGSRRRESSWTRYLPYGVILVTVAGALALFAAGVNPALEGRETLRRNWVLVENGAILLVGVTLAPVFGGRVYCRILCPFRAVSRLLAGYAVVKIGPRAGARCLQCRKCADACPMEISVDQYVANGQRVRSRDCILCERCVAACPVGRLDVTLGLPWR